ncbi:hypothetical protein QU487_06685 [Crenobacter sp. SG2305]|uniref:hypothetical protein n=1 Tax=Crenobacter oryzisoli TaxID=3056844 RepID=UPI0025AAFA83|nr:hypothetical protein [Crenobacter sp. SG2305]MDN0082440.1 hypothetical protein [Crenobacter sp. SG2305]
MKKKLIVLAALASLGNTAFAQDLIGGKCATPGQIGYNIDGKMLSCVNGKFERPEKIEKVQIALQLQEGNKILWSGTMNGFLDGQPVIFEQYQSRPYVSSVVNDGGVATLKTDEIKTGFLLKLAPSQTQDGNILIKVELNKTDLAQIQKTVVDGKAIELPGINSMELAQFVAIKNGEAAQINFGPSNGMASEKGRYILTLRPVKQS